ncbi:MAG: methyltransferase domain-containing protein [Spirochaetaceae bacterium]|nr:methyltransferase domain-containing protein [Myxococcales bacterium]MCB9725180.1 methyltransferase domain-containing protein [Spirochaetaceae bacterium]
MTTDACVDAVGVAETTEAYYDSTEADSFYAAIWGGEDIHIGIYESPDEAVATASARTVERMADALPALGADARVLDLGAGYGGAGRALASRFGCRVDCLNLSEVQNERNRVLTRAAGLEDRVRVVHASFESIPGPEHAYDVVWSQDAMLHSGARARVLSEVARVLVPGGHFVFTDPMQTDDCPADVLQPVLDRIHLDSLASPGFYRKHLDALGFSELGYEDLTRHLREHYASVGRQLASRRDEMVRRCGPDYVTRMLEGLQHWVDAADRGHLSWGIFRFRKHG